MSRPIHILRPAAVATLALVGCLAVAAPAAGAKKKGGKKKGSGGTVDITQVVNAPIPTRTTGPAAQDGVLTSTIVVSKKGMRIRDVNATVQTLGTSGTTPADDLIARLVAPNGVHTFLFDDLDGFSPATDLSIGPLTLDDEAPFDLGEGPPDNATMLFAPWLGTAAPETPLFPLDNGPVSGTWRLDIFDDTSSGTSNLVLWRLIVVTGRPFRTK
jgi:hypothetical protein